MHDRAFGGAVACWTVPGAGQSLSLESPACPVPVKKQRKYNLARWAVTGRDNHRHQCRLPAHLSRACWPRAADAGMERALLSLVQRFSHPSDRKTLDGLLRPAESGGSTLERAVAADAATRARRRRSQNAISTSKRPRLRATLDRRRGLGAREPAICRPISKPALGGLPHGYFDDIALAADWYTGDSVFEAPGEHKLTDLEWCEARQFARKPMATFWSFARIETPKGPIEKHLRFCADAPRVEFDLDFPLAGLGQGRAAAGPFHPAARSLRSRHARILTTCNGGGRESISPWPATPSIMARRFRSWSRPATASA